MMTLHALLALVVTLLSDDVRGFVGPSVGLRSTRVRSSETQEPDVVAEPPPEVLVPNNPKKHLSSTLSKVLPVAAVVTPAVAHGMEALPLFDGGVLFQATSLVFLSEIGDKTFFIASILAARASRILAFAGAFGALVLMTVASVVIGQIFHSVPDWRGIPIDDYVAVLSFAYFGVKSISAAIAPDDDVSMDSELKEAEEELEKSEARATKGFQGLGVAAEAFALTVAAEIGDRSQITTIALSASQNPFIVTIGACLGHGLATGIAVLGGAFISKFVNEKQISLIAGVLFIIFAATTLVALF